jgi:hypothetical protein
MKIHSRLSKCYKQTDRPGKTNKDMARTLGKNACKPNSEAAVSKGRGCLEDKSMEEAFLGTVIMMIIAILYKNS